jgi:hypothetical protein
MTQPPSAARTSPIVAGNIAAWRGQDVIDRDGEKVDELDELFYDGKTDGPPFAAAKRGRIGPLTLVPLAGASVGPIDVRVDADNGTGKGAPSLDTDVGLSVEDDAAAYRLYGVEYTRAGEKRAGRRSADAWKGRA